MSTTAPEYLTSLRDGFADAVQQWLDQSTTAWDQWQRAWSPVVEAAGLGMPGAPGPAPGYRSKRGHDHGRGRGHDHGHGPDHHQEHGHDHRHGERGCGCGGSGGCREHDHDHAAKARHHQEHDSGHHGQHDHQGCGCHDWCGCGDVCDCCVPAADVIVRARAGEVRVVPFMLHNPWRRERELSLEVGPWHGCDGDDLEIRAVLEEEKVVLKPCEDRVVRLLISTRGDRSSTSRSADVVEEVSKDPASDAPTKPTKAAAAAASAREPVDVVVGSRSRTGDGDSCVSAYADVRFEGCARPQRVAVVVLPAACDAVDVGCDCGCCC